MSGVQVIRYGKFVLAIAYLILPLFSSSASASAPRFTRYIGVLRHDDLQFDQLAKIDFIVKRDDNGQPESMAVLTLHAGDFHSMEYEAYHFERVIYDSKTHELILDQHDEPVSVRSTKFDGEVLEATLTHVWGAKRARLILKRDTAAKPELPLIEPLWGEYGGHCGRHPTTLQMVTFRTTDDTMHLTHSLSSYEMRGQVGEWDLKGGLVCGFGTDRPCLSDNIEDASYDFFNQKLVVFTNRRAWYCTVTKKGWDCGNCKFTRSVEAQKAFKYFHPAIAKPAFSSQEPSMVVGKPPTTAFTGGIFRGYLHHEYLNQYQRGEIQIQLLPWDETAGERNRKIQVSAFGRLYFGSGAEEEMIPYRFAEVVLPSDRPEVVVLKNRRMDFDAVVQITEYGEDFLKGVWYSRLFGRVGTFYFKKGELPVLAKDVEVMDAIHGRIESTDANIDFHVRAGRTNTQTDNPFFPNLLDGHLYFRGLTVRNDFLRGSFDFYTGRFGGDLARGQSFGGQRLSNQKWLVNLTVLPMLAPMTKFNDRPFRRSVVEERER